MMWIVVNDDSCVVTHFPTKEEALTEIKEIFDGGYARLHEVRLFEGTEHDVEIYVKVKK